MLGFGGGGKKGGGEEGEGGKERSFHGMKKKRFFLGLSVAIS